MSTDEHQSIISIFDSNCVSFGDQDVIIYPQNDESSVCYLEIQEYSRDVAAQLWHRFRPSCVLLDCLGHVAAEAVCLLACIRIGVEFVPISSNEGNIEDIVQTLRQSQTTRQQHIAAIVCCENDQDPILGVFAKADIHQILYIDSIGNLRERLYVPEYNPEKLPSSFNNPKNHDNLYILFTSGTTNLHRKAVVGSHTSTLRRLEWFHTKFPPSSRVGRRTPWTFVDGIHELLGPLLFPPSQLVATKTTTSMERSTPGNYVSYEDRLGSLAGTGVTQLTLLPSQLRYLLEHDSTGKGPWSSLERVIVSGEFCPPSVVKRFLERFPRTTLIHLYGQTESTGDVLCAILSELDDSSLIVNNVVAVGTPILPEIIQVTSTLEQELIIKGNLANGYLNSVTKPFTSFNTGDIGFFHNGNWYIQGRKDDAMKVNGVWTYLTEVESVFGTFYNIPNVVSTVVENQIYVVTDRSVPTFSREEMRNSGIPWNLIPKQVLVYPQIPTKSSGVGKIDRLRVHEMVKDTMQGIAQGGKEDSLEYILAEVLQLSSKDIDTSKSFVEMGGDSASAVTFLFLLRTRIMDVQLTLAEILSTDSISQMKKSLLSGIKPIVKRQKRAGEDLFSTMATPTFHVKPVTQVSQEHHTISFAACVDAKALIHPNGKSCFAACQGGVIQHIDLTEFTVISYNHFKNWRVQSDPLLIANEEKLIVCCYSSHENKSMVTCLRFDLQEIVWQHHFEDAKITSTPLLQESQVWINLGQCAIALSVQDGSQAAKIDLPLSSNTKPILFNTILIYASSDFDTGLMFLYPDGTSSVYFSDSIGPVHKNPILSHDGFLLVSDSYGSIHRINLDSKSIQSIQVSSKPLTSACQMKNYIWVGSYDSYLYCLSASDWKMDWTFYAGATIFATPTYIDQGSVAISTTAGDVIIVDEKAEVRWKYRLLSGEIWAPSVYMEQGYIIFGARDSRLHILNCWNSNT
jgi:acyl-CoA synthetase (AMP-forming)/AMP-acid ligase II